MEQKERKLPLHTRLGLRLLQVLIIILCLVLVQRCVGIYFDNRDVDEQVKAEYFERGYASGMKKSIGMPVEAEPHFENYAYKKAYRDGYRQGWDSGRKQEQRY